MTTCIEAKLTLYSGTGKRQTPFSNGYRPLFSVGDDGLVSGMIELRSQSEVRPGDTATVEIKFVKDHALHAGMRVEFFEAVEPLGHIEVLRKLSDGCQPENE